MSGCNLSFYDIELVGVGWVNMLSIGVGGMLVSSIVISFRLMVVGLFFRCR